MPHEGSDLAWIYYKKALVPNPELLEIHGDIALSKAAAKSLLRERGGAWLIRFTSNPRTLGNPLGAILRW